jgi:hypothetical protein
VEVACSRGARGFRDWESKDAAVAGTEVIHS